MQQGPLGNKKLCVDLRQSLYSLINLFKNQASVAQSRKLLLGVESWAVSSGSLCYHLQLDKAEWGPPSARAVILGQFPILQRQCLWDLAEITELGQALSSLDHHRRAISSYLKCILALWVLRSPAIKEQSLLTAYSISGCSKCFTRLISFNSHY